MDDIVNTRAELLPLDYYPDSSLLYIASEKSVFMVKSKTRLISVPDKKGSIITRYFYTFGSNPSFPYQNGWVEIHAASREEADCKFRTRFPDCPGHEGIMNYAFCYDENQWAKMDPEHTWQGWKLHEVIE